MADVAGTLNEWSTTASSNFPAGATSIGTGLDDNLREIQAVVKQYLATYNATPIASGGTTAIGGHAGLFIEISGTTTITAFGTPTTGSPWKIVRFQDALTLTHNGTSLILPGAANITTAAGDYCLAFHRGSGNWTVAFYSKADGTATIFINGLTAETDPALTDTVALYDASASANRKMTLANLLKIIADLTETAIDPAADYFMFLDATDGAVKKVLGSDISTPYPNSVTVYTTGSGTYSVPAGVRALHVKLVGGGGGGQGTAGGGNGSDGGDTTFGSLTGSGGMSGGNGRTGGAASGGDVNIAGQTGQASDAATGFIKGGTGGGTVIGPGALGGGGNSGAAGTAPANTGGGGATGGGTTGTTGAANAGGGGGYCEKWILPTLDASYSYGVGAGGAGGSAGSGGDAGSAGSDGIIIIEAYA